MFGAMSLFTKFKAAVEAATDAALVQDYSTALVQARAARIALTAIPKSELDREVIEHSRDDLDAMIRDLERSVSEQESTRTGLMQESRIHYTRH